MKKLKAPLLVLAILFYLGCKEEKKQANIHSHNTTHEYNSEIVVDTLAEGIVELDTSENPYIGNEEISFNEEIENKIIYIKFTQPINGFDLMDKVEGRHNETGHPAILSFSKDGKKVSEIQLTDFWFKELVFDKYPDGYTLISDFLPSQIHNKGVINLETLKDVPFFFMDIDFDGEKEFIANYYGLGQRSETKYVPFKFPEGEELKKDPFDEIDSLTGIDFENKIIITTSIISGTFEWWITTYKKSGSKFSKTIEKHEIQYDNDYNEKEMIQTIFPDGTVSAWKVAPPNKQILKK